MSIKVAINGFGRIGRNLLRCSVHNPELEFVAANDLTRPEVLGHLLKYDSVLGRFDGKIDVKEDALVVNGKPIKIFAERDPGSIKWEAVGAQIVVESTGLFTEGEKARAHLRGPVKKVVISAPGKNVDGTFCMGVNMERYDSKKHNIVSNASCTTNCLAPLAKVLDDSFGIESGFMTTIHSYTNDQRILDLPHEDLRRGRAAAVNIVPSSTGAAKAIGEVIPELKGKLNGGAFRVPTPDGSVTDFTAILEKDATIESINLAFKNAAGDKSYHGVLEYSDEPLVSRDILGNPHSCIFDSQLTMTHGGRFVKIVGWYDNEWGYSNRC